MGACEDLESGFVDEERRNRSIRRPLTSPRGQRVAGKGCSGGHSGPADGDFMRLQERVLPAERLARRPCPDFVAHHLLESYSHQQRG